MVSYTDPVTGGIIRQENPPKDTSALWVDSSQSPPELKSYDTAQSQWTSAVPTQTDTNLNWSGATVDSFNKTAFTGGTVYTDSSGEWIQEVSGSITYNGPETSDTITLTFEYDDGQTFTVDKSISNGNTKSYTHRRGINALLVKVSVSVVGDCDVDGNIIEPNSIDLHPHTV